MDECFAAFAPAAHLAQRRSEVEIALWFHDAIYDTRANDNEARSAAWARDAVIAAGGRAESAARVHALILATEHHAVPDEADARVVVDVDLAILGADSERFAEYERQIRREYSWVPEPEFRSARARLLRAFLGRTAIYSTRWFAERLEPQARWNLSRSIHQLEP